MTWRGMEFELSGVAEINEVLRRLPPKISDKVWVSSLRAGAGVVARDMKARVHVRSGDLRDAIVVRKSPIRKQKFGAGLVVIAFKQPTSRRAHLEEFGTSHSPAHPFMRPALAAKGAKAIEVIGAATARVLARETKKLEGKFRTSGLSTRKRRRR